MTDLKTIDDIESFKDGDFLTGDDIIRKKHIRQEAIKDIKAIRKGIELPIRGGTQIYRSAIENYIMWKFNLTEDDLK